MKLSDYIRRNGLSQREFASKADLPESTVSAIVRSLRRPDWGTIDAIKRATRGAVTANDLDVEP